MSTKASDAKSHFSDDLYQKHIKIFLINSKEDNNKDDLWQEKRKIYRKTSNIVDIVGSMIIDLLIALTANKFQFDSKMN